MGKIKRNDHENHTLQRDTFLETVFKVSARVCSYIFYIIWEISFNAIAYSIYLSFLWVEVPWIFMSFLFCQYGKFLEIQKRKYIPEENYQWNETVNMKRAKPKTYRGEMSFWLMKMTPSSGSLQLRRFPKSKNTLQLVYSLLRIRK